uniref:Uncharacterized protein n=1 Tax=Vibrio parahaemolyticus TaxID=670 RepID=A0A0C5H1M8_VIBPH|nr:hypothetical protein pVPH1_0212 [Vibrio parahaemolyticus]
MFHYTPAKLLKSLEQMLRLLLFFGFLIEKQSKRPFWAIVEAVLVNVVM